MTVSARALASAAGTTVVNEVSGAKGTSLTQIRPITPPKPKPWWLNRPTWRW